jgi:biopolymer transport protein ExbD
MPEINLIPMLDVLMTVLTFFIIVSMSLTGEQLFNLNLPTGEAESGKKTASENVKLTIGLDKDGKTVMDNQPATEPEVVQRVQKFLSENPEGVVTLKADKGLKYENVLGLLRILRDMGGDRVFLAIEKA